MLKMELTTILTIFVLNIFLPTFDTITDIILVIKLYKGQYKSRQDKSRRYLTRTSDA